MREGRRAGRRRHPPPHRPRIHQHDEPCRLHQRASASGTRAPRRQHQHQGTAPCYISEARRLCRTTDAATYTCASTRRALALHRCSAALEEQAQQWPRGDAQRQRPNRGYRTNDCGGRHEQSRRADERARSIPPASTHHHTDGRSTHVADCHAPADASRHRTRAPTSQCTNTEAAANVMPTP
jgi:hypothetical protein